MSRYIEMLQKRQENFQISPHKALTKPTEAPFVSNVSACPKGIHKKHYPCNPAEFPAWAQTEADKIAALPDSEQEQALAEFENHCAQFDALTKETKGQALSMLVG